MIFLYNFSITLYNILIHLAAFFGNEKAKLWVNGRKSIFKKIKNDLDSKLKTQNPKRIWIHVASLGEFEQGRPIIEALKTNNQQPTTIILTFFSPSGYEIRKNYPLVDHIFYLPIDSKKNAQAFLDIVKPDLALFVKYEFWYHYLNELNQRQIPILLVSAIFREKQFNRFNPYTHILMSVLKTFKHIFVQDTPSVSLLQKQGISQVTCVGDTRIDRVVAIAQEAKQFPIIENFVQNAPVFIGGSTWQADETLIATVFSNPKFNDWTFILAPHDISPKNIDRLEKLLPEPTQRYSQLNANNQQPTTRILIIDNIGMLSALYRYGRIAYIGGGFGSGIHNTLEPIAFGLPVIFGLKYQKFAEAVELVKTRGGFSVANTHDFQNIMESLLSEGNYHKAAHAAKSYASNNQGATEKIVSFIKTLS